MKLKDLEGWPPQWKPPGGRLSGRLTGVAMDRRKPEIILLTVDVGGQTAFGLLHLDRSRHAGVFGVLSEHTGETLRAIGELSLDDPRLRKAHRSRRGIWKGLLEAAHKCFAQILAPAVSPRRRSKIPL